MLTFQPVTPENEAHVARIFAGDEAQYWVHYNTYWLDNSRTVPGVEARLIYEAGASEPLGFIAYGQHYADEALTEAVLGSLEIIHMVIDAPHQRRGYGREATLQAIRALRDWPGQHRIVIAHNPSNGPARHLYESLGFVVCGENYDGDPLLELQGDPQ
ncbi:Acetyltransferase (GNAT) family protein [Deinococcus reticulitermitis]|uniref:Acetyltransferase (GNAT) family protein n=1 Tax=Deinococcus reticulitermitis TaxID=856736 RepID=A0A1H6ZPG4_9DEIO|nr:GNAT family protein [Deinococcus reticulitermitis]SEJ54054.1 Acetyltransferase (GNAT) family protein [Deinococcus reticulitermitis]